MALILIIFLCMSCLLTGCTYNGIEYFGHNEDNTYELRAAYQSSVDYLLSDFNTKEVSARQNQKILSYDFIETSITIVGSSSDDILGEDNNSTVASKESKHIDGANHKGKSLGKFIITGYCPCRLCCGVYSNVKNPTTASGAKAVAGYTIAVDTAKFPFGTKLVINNQVYEAQDRGGKIKGNRIDMYFNTHHEALVWGKRTIEVFEYVD